MCCFDIAKVYLMFTPFPRNQIIPFCKGHTPLEVSRCRCHAWVNTCDREELDRLRRERRKTHQISLGRCLLTTQDSVEYGFRGTQERDVDKAESHALHAEVILCSFLSFVWRETLTPGHLYPMEM